MSDSCMNAWFFVTSCAGYSVDNGRLCKADADDDPDDNPDADTTRSYMHETGTCGVGTEQRPAPTPLIACVPVEFK